MKKFCSVRWPRLAAVLVLLCTTLFAQPARAAAVVSTCDEASLLAALAADPVVTFACSGTIRLSGTINITGSTTIDGAGQAVILSGDTDGDDTPDVRLFKVTGGPFTLRNLTVAKGFAPNSGSFPQMGGAMVINGGAVNIENVTFRDNLAYYYGGAIYYRAGELRITGSTFMDNKAYYVAPDSSAMYGSGGAIYAVGSTVIINNSTFFRNTAYIGGGAIYNEGISTMEITNSTISGNHINSHFGSALINMSTLRLYNTIVANNTRLPQCYGTITDGGGNLAWGDSTCPGTLANPQLGDLADNGGPTWTLALGEGSPAIDAADPATCPAGDQRGYLRRGACDIGAYEYAALPPRDLSIALADDAGGAATVGTPFHWTLTVANPSPYAVSLDAPTALLWDDLPAGADYGTPALANPNGVTGAENLACAIETTGSAARLACAATGALAIAAGGSLEVVLPVTPTAVGTLQNPASAGVCRLDPEDVLIESNESNNDCTGSLPVAPNILPASVALADLEQTYDGTPKPATVSVTPEGVSVVVTYTPAGSSDSSTIPPADAGSYTVVAAIADPAYQGDPASGVLIIHPRPVTVAADPQSKLYGQPDPALTYQVTTGSLVDGDAFTGALARDPGEAVGSYTIRQGTLALSANYSLSYTEADLTIGQAGTATMLGALPGSILLHQPLTLVANVAALAPAAGIPEGTLTFMDGTTVLAADVPLVNGQASFATTGLALGPHTIQAIFNGGAGWTASASPAASLVVTYRFVGFSAPVDNPGVINLAKAGQTIPLKWRLLDYNGLPVTNLTGVKVTAVSLTCPMGTSTDQLEEYAAGSSGLQNLGDGYYQWNWKTPSTYARSCKTLTLDLGEGAGSEHLALFQFRK